MKPLFLFLALAALALAGCESSESMPPPMRYQQVHLDPLPPSAAV